jgi:hypothetical protein
MTHDELLYKIDNDHEYWTSLRAQRWAKIPEINALRAVVELHTTFTPEFGGGIDYCWADDRPYPCPTIQAIEKELW